MNMPAAGFCLAVMLQSVSGATAPYLSHTLPLSDRHCDDFRVRLARSGLIHARRENRAGHALLPAQGKINTRPLSFPR
jgi:hypothetical protein